MSDVIKRGPMIRISSGLEADALTTRAAVDEAFDRALNPWKYPDRNPMPNVTPLPLLARLTEWWANRHHCDCEDDE